MKGSMFLLIMFLISFSAWATTPMNQSIYLIESNPSEAYEQLELVDNNVSKAFRAYIDFIRKDTAKADKLIKEAVLSMNDSFAKEMALKLDDGDDSFFLKLRFVVEDVISQGDRDISIPCFMFRRHPQNAYKAFGAYWGSSRDAVTHCLEAKIEMEKIEAFKKFDDFLNAHEDLPDGTMLFSQNRMSHTYLIKAWETPEKTVSEVGLKKFTFNEFQQKYPKWNRGLIELKLLHEKAAQRLSEIYINRGLKPGLAYDHAYEILETYASYRLLKGLIY